MSAPYRDIANALNTLYGLPGFNDEMCGKQVTYKSGERGTCCYVEHNTTDVAPYCMVKPRNGGAIQLWWLNLTTVDN